MDVKELLNELHIPIVPAYSLKTIYSVLELYKKKGINGVNSPELSPLTNPMTKLDSNSESSICKIPKKELKIKKGDVFMSHGMNGKRRPFVVAKVVKNGVYAIPLTTKQDCYTLIPHHSRFLSAGYFANYLIFVKTEVVSSGFSSILDDNRSLNEAIRLIKEKLSIDIL